MFSNEIRKYTLDGKANFSQSFDGCSVLMSGALYLSVGGGGY